MTERGQASVETVALLPLLVVVVLAAVHVLAAGAAEESASAAAEAGAAAILQEGDPEAAAKQALGASSTARTTITVRGREVTVRVRPRAPIGALADALTAEANAHAGPGPAVASSTAVVRGGDGASARPPAEDEDRLDGAGHGALAGGRRPDDRRDHPGGRPVLGLDDGGPR